jgi:hypothetical protein
MGDKKQKKKQKTKKQKMEKKNLIHVGKEYCQTEL